MSIFRKGENWFIDYRCKGKRFREKVSPNKTLARQALAKRKAEIAEGRFFPNRKRNEMVFGQMAEAFWNRYGKHKRAVSYPYMYKRVVGEFGAMRIEDVSVPVLIDFLNKLKESTSRSNSNRYHTFLSSVFSRAMEWGIWEGNNPLSKIRKEKEPVHRTTFLSKSEIGSLLQACPDRIYPIVVCALFTGMRRGEMLKLIWKDVNLEHNVLYVLESKNGRAREIPIAPKLAKVLESMSPADKDGRVFSVTEDVLDKDFRRALWVSGIRNFRFHDLRHTFASYFIMRTSDLPALQKILGHSSPVMTQRYAHLASSHVQAEMRIFDAGMDTFWTPEGKVEGVAIAENR